jgi:hypothetical protein
MPIAGIEPASSRPQREVLTTILYGLFICFKTEFLATWSWIGITVYFEIREKENRDVRTILWASICVFFLVP